MWLDVLFEVRTVWGGEAHGASTYAFSMLGVQLLLSLAEPAVCPE